MLLELRNQSQPLESLSVQNFQPFVQSKFALLTAICYILGCDEILSSVSLLTFQ